jgi:hypothetical protein
MDDGVSPNQRRSLVLRDAVGVGDRPTSTLVSIYIGTVSKKTYVLVSSLDEGQKTSRN